MEVMGIIGIVVLGIANLVNVPWTLWLVTEQLETGWGYGTNIEMMALMVWMVEFVSIPAAIFAIVYFVLYRIDRRSEKPLKTKNKIVIANVVLLVCFVLQIGITNLFIWN